MFSWLIITATKDPNDVLPAERFLAAFLLEKLVEKKELEISGDELERIGSIKSSSELVPFCSGCTLWTEIPLKDLFDEGSTGVVSSSANYWFDTYYNAYYKKVSAGWCPLAWTYKKEDVLLRHPPLYVNWKFCPQSDN